MNSIPYHQIPQLQAVIFTVGFENILPVYYGSLSTLGKFGGIPVYVKLNNRHAVRLELPLTKNCLATFSDSDREEEVIPVDIGMSRKEIHAAIVAADLGHFLLDVTP